MSASPRFSRAAGDFCVALAEFPMPYTVSPASRGSTPNTARRIDAATPDDVNERIRRQTRDNILHFAVRRDQIPLRLQTLDEEWDVERCLETTSASFSLLGLAFTLLFSVWWLALPLVVQTFFLYHAIVGWCPPLPLLRSMGYRTAREIEAERHALRILSGAYADAIPVDDVRAAERLADRILA
jgi:hypothetical protein